jgi:hypothetical protein
MRSRAARTCCLPARWYLPSRRALWNIGSPCCQRIAAVQASHGSNACDTCRVGERPRVDRSESIQRDRLCDTRRGSCPNRPQSSTGSYCRWIWTTTGGRNGARWLRLDVSSLPGSEFLDDVPVRGAAWPRPLPDAVPAGRSLVDRGQFRIEGLGHTVAAAALLYGVIGVFTLGVEIDAVLLAGAIVLGGQAVFGVRRMDACRNTMLP